MALVTETWSPPRWRDCALCVVSALACEGRLPEEHEISVDRSDGIAESVLQDQCGELGQRHRAGCIVLGVSQSHDAPFQIDLATAQSKYLGLTHAGFYREALLP